MQTLRPNQCPYCRSIHIARMDRLDDHVSATFWMQCDDCRRAWAVPRPPPAVLKPPDNKNSPDS